MGFSVASIFACAASRRLTKACRRPVVELLLQVLLLLLVPLVARFAEQVVDRVLVGLVEAQEQLCLVLLHLGRFLGLQRGLVLPALLGIAADRLFRGLQIRAGLLQLLLGLRRLEPLARALLVRLEMRLLQLEELPLVVLPRPARDHLVVDRPGRGEREQHGEADEGPLQALQLERLSGHVRCSRCLG
jgi:hypothetical protein